jgi:hypothetical protein
VLAAEPVSSKTSQGIAIKAIALAVAPEMFASCKRTKGARDTLLGTIEA